MTTKIIAQGAEAIITLEKNLILKNRIKKSYRISELDEKIRKQRTKKEIKLLTKAAEIINSPLPIETKDFDKIQMPYIEGKRLSEHLDSFPLKKQKTICKQIGTSISKLHDNEIIHGDLTTSNMILSKNKTPKGEKSDPKKAQSSIYFIDFGLGYISRKYEDKAVDLHLLKQALEAKHFKNWEILIKEVFSGYKKSKDSSIVFERLKTVEKRGRYKH
ncbi:Kae1-associated serine/threonine protein kinase [archaeon]|jgi:TP53 regulating kinase and related kinases|nr:Kae1-associated serine/threonine protein kinase [archaeon]